MKCRLFIKTDSTQVTRIVDEKSAKSEFANELYKHLSRNHWLTSDKREISDIIESGKFVDFNFRLELKRE